MSFRLQRAELITSIIIVGFFLSVCFHYAMHYYYHRPYPYTTFLSWPEDYHTDYTRIVDAAKSGNPYRYQILAFHGPGSGDPYRFHLQDYHGPGGEVGNYFPFTYMVALIFGARHGGIFIFLGLFLAGLASYLYRQSGIRTDPQIPPLSKIRLVFVLALMSYPVLWEIDRGNLEALTLLLMAVATALIGQGKGRLWAIPLALAIAMKGYPAIFLLLYLPARKYREAALAIALSLAVCVVGFSVFHGGLIRNVLSFRTDLAFFLDYYVFRGAGTAGARMDCSPFAPLGVLNSNPAFIKHALLFYNGLSLLAGLLLVWLVAARKMERWKLEYLLAAGGLLLPSISYDYKLMILFIPLVSFLNSARRERLDAFFCASFGAMLIPKDYFYIGSVVSVGNGVSVSSLLELLILIATVIVIVRQTLARGADGEVGEIVREEGGNTDNDHPRNDSPRNGDPGTLHRNPGLS